MKKAAFICTIFVICISDGVNAQNVGIGTNAPSEKLHVVGGARITSLNGGSYRLIQSDATGVLSNIIDGNSGQFLTTNGAGLLFWANGGNPDADNGLYYNSGVNRIRLGGPLVETTTITHGAYTLTHNLNSTGDFVIQDAGVSMFLVRDNGISYFGDDVYWRDVSTGGTNLMVLTDDGNDGRLRIYENGLTSVDLDANTQFVFNQQGLDRNFRIETDLRANMFFVDAGLNRIGINTATPAMQWQFVSDGAAGWVTQWYNTSVNGGLKQIYNTATGNGSRVLMGVTNYSGSTNAASAVMGLSLNVTTTGNGGIGVTGAANNESGMAVEGSLYTVGGYSGWGGYFNADVYCGGWYFGSDRRLKRDIEPIKSAVGIVKQLTPVSYYYDTDRYPEMGLDENRLSYGFIAQDLEQVLPELVKEKNLVLNSNRLMSADELSKERKTDLFKVVNYTLMIPLLTQAVKEQQEIIEGQNEKIDRLEKEIEKIKALLQK